MITAERKPFEEIKEYVRDYKNIMVLGCGTCVAVCQAGGEKEAEILASELRLTFGSQGKRVEVNEETVVRQCDDEFMADPAFLEKVKEADVIISIACGVGVQHACNFLNRAIEGKPIRVVPGLNTTFMGANIDLGLWEERCLGCGDCVLERTGGICPITRCAKSLLNGPCGGSSGGKCELSTDIDCAWHLIIERLETLGELERIRPVEMYRDWRPSHSGGPRKILREDLRL
ncbi:MAG: methylenetetrahydrofolate reductase C-terminal domain-containing protein [Deltaproteobacteria bacterium]|nr:MAG: methylenetetrahydrofolate reductase C-terminal domain-containing protein [Deltaproteobacteria bacterium]